MTNQLFRGTIALLCCFGILIGCIRPAEPSTPTSIATLAATDTPVPATPTAPTPVINEGTAWWNEAVFYEIFVRSFADSNGDGTGDLNGLIGKLDYLNDGDPATNDDLGVTALWLMPIFPSPSYHGYDVTNYYDVNPDYGTKEDFQKLMSEAHRRGIRVVIDFVVNHTSIEYPWFKEAQTPTSPYHDWYVWSATDPGYRGPWGEQVWYPKADSFYYAVFWEGMPDLNYKNPAVVAEIDKVATFWLTEMGVDGFRVDGARYLVEEDRTLADSEGTHAYFRHLREVSKAINPNAMMVGEVWTDSNAVATYAQGDQFDLLFNFDLAGAQVESAASQRADAARIGLAIALSVMPTTYSANFLTNHDQDRVMSGLRDDVNKAKRAATLLLTAPGTPFIYYGEEIGQLGVKPDEDLRLPMQWSSEENAGFSTSRPWRAPAADYPSKNVTAQLADGNSLLAHYRALIQLRSSLPALSVGEGYKVKSANSAVLALLRATVEQQVLIITNLSEEGIADYAVSMESGPLTAAATYTPSAIWGDGPFASLVATEQGGFTNYQPTPGLAPGQTLIIELKKE